MKGKGFVKEPVEAACLRVSSVFTGFTENFKLPVVKVDLLVLRPPALISSATIAQVLQP